MKQPWVKHGKKLVEMRQYYDAQVWQYMIDHAGVSQTGQIQISFTVDGKDDFVRKVSSRLYSHYSKQDVVKIEALAKELREEWKKTPKRKWKFYDYAYWWLLRQLNKLVKHQLGRYQPDIRFKHRRQYKDKKKPT